MTRDRELPGRGWSQRLEVVPAGLVAASAQGADRRAAALARAAFTSTRVESGGAPQLFSVGVTAGTCDRPPLRAHAPVLIVEGPAPDLEAWIEVDPREARDGIARALDAPSLPPGPFTEIELAALEPSVADALSASAPGWTLADIAPSLRALATTPPRDRLASTWRRGDRWARTHITPTAAAALPDDAPHVEVPAWSPPVVVRVALAGITASPADLQSLAPGDVLLGLCREARVHLGSRARPGLRAALEASSSNLRITLLHPAHLEGEAHVSDDDRSPTSLTSAPPDAEPTLHHARVSSASERAPSILEDIAVEVEVELCRVAVPMVDVASWVPGKVVDLQRDAASPVELRVGDATIGRGHLVEIEGRLGVRLLELGGRGP